MELHGMSCYLFCYLPAPVAGRISQVVGARSGRSDHLDERF